MDTPNTLSKEKELARKNTRREKKKRPKMKVDSGKVRGLAQIIRKKA